MNNTNMLFFNTLNNNNGAMRTQPITFSSVLGSSGHKDFESRPLIRMRSLKIIRTLLLSFLLSLIMATAVMLVAQPQYQVTSSFSIATPGFNQSSALSIPSPKTNADSQQNLNAEVDFLTSKSNILHIVQQFNLSVSYIKPGRFIDQDLYQQSPINFKRIRMGSRSSGQIRLKLKNQHTYLLTRGKAKAQEYAFDTTYTDDLGSWQISKNPNYGKFIGSTLRIDVVDPEYAVAELQARLNVSQSGKSGSLLTASIADPVLTRAYDILNGLLVSYLENSQIEKERLAQSQLHFVDGQIIQLEKELNTINERLKFFPNQNGQNNYTPTEQRFLKLVKTNDQLLNRLNWKISGLNTLETQLRAQKNTRNDTLNNAVFDPLLNAVVRTFYETRTNYNRLLLTRIPEDPEVKGTLQQLERQKIFVIQEINDRLLPLQSKRNHLMATNAVHEKELTTLSKQEIRRMDLLRQLQVIPPLYADLNRSRENAALNHASYLAYSVPLNNKMVFSESRHLSFSILLIGFGISLIFLMGRELWTLGRNHT